MKKLYILLSLILISLFAINSSIYAHSRGIPILIINGQLTKVYPIESSSIEPYLGDSSDIASENYIINQNLEFEFDPTKTELIPPQIDLEKLTYIWDFGDGTQKQSTRMPKSGHTYTKMGSYIPKIIVDFSKTEFPGYGQQIVQSSLIHVLPDKNYKLPEPIIKVNNQKAQASQEASSGASYIDRLRLKGQNSMEFDFNNRLSFDASDSKAGSSRITQFQWDLVQQDVKTGKKVSIKYRLPQAIITPVLRVTDENGFIVDTYVNLENSGKNEPTGVNIKDYVSGVFIFIIVQVLVLIVGIIWYFKIRKG